VNTWSSESSPALLAAASTSVWARGRPFSFGGLSLAGGLTGMAVASDIYGILATTAGTGTASRYAFGIPQASLSIFPTSRPAVNTPWMSPQNCLQ